MGQLRWFVALIAVLALGGVAGAAGHYVKVADIHIGGAGAFDYLAVDASAKRLYVTHGTEIVVIDTATNTIVGRIADTPRVHGIAIARNGRGFTSNGGENKVSIVDLKTLATLSKVDTGANPDATRCTPSTTRASRRRSSTPTAAVWSQRSNWAVRLRQAKPMRCSARCSSISRTRIALT